MSGPPQFCEVWKLQDGDRDEFDKCVDYCAQRPHRHIPLLSLQKPLPCRRLGSLESRTEQIGQVVADIQQVSGLREDATKERLTGMEKALREIQRNVQIIRDKQVGFAGPKA